LLHFMGKKRIWCCKVFNEWYRKPRNNEQREV
jgi:hypothetical protein